MARKIIITGSEGLIGKALADAFAAQGDEVVRFDLALGHDLTDEGKVRELFSAHRDGEYLVNLFAINDHVEPGKQNPSLADVSLDSLRQFCEVNLVALFSVCRQFVAHALKPRAIVNFSSLYGVRSPKHFLYGESSKHIGYTISKHGVVGLTRHLATAWAPRAIRVNCLVPGGVRHRQDEAFLNAYGKEVPLGRMMQPAELFGIVDLLCSERSTYLTGGTIAIDGGWTAW